MPEHSDPQKEPRKGHEPHALHEAIRTHVTHVEKVRAALHKPPDPPQTVSRSLDTVNAFQTPQTHHNITTLKPSRTRKFTQIPSIEPLSGTPELLPQNCV